MAGKKYKYKRSWRNLLLNKGVQLRFTLFLCGLAAVLMVGLGYWVLSVAGRATDVAATHIESIDCAKLAMTAAPASAVPNVPVLPATPAVEDKEETPTRSERRRKVRVESSMEIVEPDAPDPDAGGAAVPDPEATPAPPERDEALFKRCNDDKHARLAALFERNDFITWSLVVVGVVMLLGLFVYGIKMTHKLAGPVYKIGQYLDQLRDMRYGPVYNLRKGDQLVEFYEHFKDAHAGLVKLQQEDIDELGAIVEAAKNLNLAQRSPDVASALQELEIMLRDKEKSIVS